jgi:hypothetical protein
VARSVYFLVLVFLAVAVETATVAVAEAVPMFIIGQTCLSQPLISTVQEENHTRGELFPGRRDVRALGGVGRPGGNLALLRTVGPSTERAESRTSTEAWCLVDVSASRSTLESCDHPNSSKQPTRVEDTCAGWKAGRTLQGGTPPPTPLPMLEA